MKSSHISLLALAIGAFSFASCSVPGVKTGERVTLRSFLNVHESPERWLRINGREYTGIVGGDPCYLEIKELDSIMFITADRKNHTYIHFVGRSGQLDVSIPETWPMDIGRPNLYKINIVRVDWPIVVITDEGSNYLVTHKFDLLKGIDSPVYHSKK